MREVTSVEDHRRKKIMRLGNQPNWENVMNWIKRLLP